MVRQARQIQVDDLPQPPRYIAHKEITAPHSVNRLFKPSSDPPESGRLSHAEELVLFKRLHYSAYRMSKMWDKLEQLSTQDQERYVNWFKQYTEIRDRLVDANLGLVFNLLGKTRFTTVDRDELRSEGLMALVRSVDTFDPWRGIRFSTYACNSIIRAFSRLGLMHSKRQHLWSTSFDIDREPVDLIDPHRDERGSLISERLERIINSKDAQLSESERFVLNQRFPRSGDRPRATLKTVGKKMRISKERVRQIQESALGKLRRALLADPILQ